MKRVPWRVPVCFPQTRNAKPSTSIYICRPPDLEGASIDLEGASIDLEGGADGIAVELLQALNAHPLSAIDSPYAWFRRILISGEAATYLALAATFSVSLKKDAIGRTINYTLREKLKLPGSEQLTLVPLSDTFEYVVRDCIGSATGRVLVLTPVAQLGTLVLAFRGMRLHGESAEDDVGPSLDRRALAGAYPTDTPWQDDDGRPLCVHSGALGHLESAWSLGLRARLSALAHDEAQLEATNEILLTGISLGGALAELCALRIVKEFPKLQPKLRVLSFGALAWADAAAGAAFDCALGPRAVRLALSRRNPAPPLAHVGWWVQVPTEANGAGGYVVFDPLVVGCEGSSLRALPNMLVCSQERHACDPQATRLLGRASITRELLRQFVAHKPPREALQAVWAAPAAAAAEGKGSREEAGAGVEADPKALMMMRDYEQLHYGARYRDLLSRLCRESQLSIWLSRVSSIELRGPWPHTEPPTVPSRELFRERTCVVFVVRRLGCPLCRELVAGLLE